MNHKDSMGYNSVVEEGGVQIMSAGSGLFHEEYNIGETEVNFLQIWIQPKLQDIKPRYQQRHFPKEHRKNMLQTIVSSEEGFDHCWINQNARLSLGYFDAGKSLEYSFSKENKCVYIFCIAGQIEVNGQQLGEKDSIGCWDVSLLTINCAQESEFIIIETVINQK